MKPVSVRPLVWIAAALVLLLGLAAPGVAQAHVHPAGHEMHAGPAASAAAQQDARSVEAVLTMGLPAAEDAAGHCHQACCAPCGSCFLVSCVTPDLAALPVFDSGAVALGRAFEAHSGTEPAGLLEPPIAL